MNQDPPAPIDPRLVEALSHPLRVQILEALSERPAPPARLAEDLGAELREVAYNVSALEEYGCLEVVRVTSRGGTAERVFKPTPTVLAVKGAWRRMPKSVRGAVSAASAQDFARRRGGGGEETLVKNADANGDGASGTPSPGNAR